MAIAAIVVAGLTAIFALADLSDVDDVGTVARAFDSEFSIGPGLYLCLVGASGGARRVDLGDGL